MKFRATLIIGALLVVASAGAVLGQGFQGGLRGSVKDAGGVIPGVEVTLTNEQTNIKRSSVTNERGEFVFANVDPGNYGVKATLQGYKTADRAGIRVGTQQFLTLDLTMEVGSITENVTENNRRRNARQGLNNERAARNDARLNAKTLLLVPTGGR